MFPVVRAINSTRRSFRSAHSHPPFHVFPFRSPTPPCIGIVGRCHRGSRSPTRLFPAWIYNSIGKSTTDTRVDFCHRLYVAKEKASRCVANDLQVARIVWNEDVDSSGSGRNRKRLDAANRAGRTGKTDGASVSRSSIEIDSPVVFSSQEAFRSPDEPTFHRTATLSSTFNARKKRLYRSIDVITFPINSLRDRSDASRECLRYVFN